MDLMEVLALVSAVVVSVTLLGMVGALLYRGGRSDQERRDARTAFAEKLDGMNEHLGKINGSVEAVTKLAHENAIKIAVIEGAHPR